MIPFWNGDAKKKLILYTDCGKIKHVRFIRNKAVKSRTYQYMRGYSREVQYKWEC